MTTTRRHLTRDDLAPLARAATGRALTGVTRLPRWQQEGRLPARPRRRHDGRRLRLVAGRGLLGRRPLRPPRPLLRRHRSRRVHGRPRPPGRGRRAHPPPPVRRRTHTSATPRSSRTCAGGSLEEALERDPVAGRAALELLAAELATLHAQEGPAFGKVGLVDNGGTSSSDSAARRVTEGALRHIEQAAVRDERIAVVRENWRRPYDSSPQPSGPAPGTPSSTANSARTTSCWTTRAARPDRHRRADVLRRRVGARLPAASASDRSTTTSCGPPAWTRTGCASTAWPCTCPWSPAPLRLIEGDFPNPDGMREIAESNLVRVLELMGR